MKKIFLAGVTAAACVMLFGCSSEKAVPKEEKSPEATSQPFTERNVEHSEGTYIFDKASLLSAEDIQACNDYAGWLYENKLINAAVVTTNDLEGKSPWDYAVDSFNEIYEGKGSGLVILINNATNEDIVYRTGSCLTNISQKSADNAMFWATKEIMGNSYRNAVMRLLQLGELCPGHMIDNSQVFAYEDIKTIEKRLSSLKKDVTVLSTRNGSSLPNDEILKTYYKRRYNDGKGIMLMLDINSRTIIAYSDGKLPDKLSAQLKSAYELALHDDYIAAVNKAIDLVEK
ncbi:MAG: TPM domain-containing protein [Ruminococcus sp.]|uniref:TPM domain-containing protein n=1 Tax=Ruminococcus sp. TaxID=41978 RepID=UPI0025DF4DB1|nr:TPM domain-containing protein [Ruminococcus sp.]MBR5683689.1 TPM domain-containing protein [Ruminococcus sp.]